MRPQVSSSKFSLPLVVLLPFALGGCRSGRPRGWRRWCPQRGWWQQCEQQVIQRCIL